MLTTPLPFSTRCSHVGPTALAGPTAPNTGDLDLGKTKTEIVDETQDISRWRSKSWSADRRSRGRGDKGHEDQKPSSNSGAPTSGAPIARVGATMQPNMQITKKGDSRVVTQTGNTISASSSGPGNSRGDQEPGSTPEKPGPPATAVTNTKVTINETKGDQPTSTQLSGLKSFRIPKHTANIGGTRTVEQIQVNGLLQLQLNNSFIRNKLPLIQSSA